MMIGYGDRIALEMRKKNISKQMLANEAGISVRALNMIIAGQTQKPKCASEIARALNVTDYYLKTGDRGDRGSPTFDAVMQRISEMNLSDSQMALLLNVANEISSNAENEAISAI